MSQQTATSTALRKRLAGKVFAFTGNWGYPAPDSVAKLLEVCGGVIAPEIDSSVTWIIGSANSKATQKLVAQLNKKGQSVGLTDVMEIQSLINVSEAELIALLHSGEADLWNVLNGLVEPIKLAGINLSEKDVSNFRLNNCVLEGANFSGCAMTNYRFSRSSGVNLSEAKLTKAQLGELRSCSFSKAVLSECTFFGKLFDCNFCSVSFDKAIANNAKFSKCDFTHSHWTACVLDRALFEDCKLSQLDFSESSFVGSTFANAELLNTCFRDANLSGADLSNAILIKASFCDANLCGTNFHNADLTEANFTGAITCGANFEGANLTNVIGLSINRKFEAPKTTIALSKIDEIAARLPNFYIGTDVKINTLSIGLLVCANSKCTYVTGNIIIRNGDSLPAKSYKTVSSAMIDLARTFPEGIMELDCIHASPPAHGKVDLWNLAIAAWHEVYNLEVPSQEEREKRAAEKVQHEKILRDQILAELKGGKSGIEKWNARVRKVTKNIPSLSEQDFSNVDMTGANLDDLALDKCNFKGAILNNASMNKSDLTASCFEGASLEKLSASRANFEEADFSNSKVIGAQIKQSKFKDATFAGADLTMCNLSDSVISGAELSSSKLDGLILDRAQYNHETKFPPGFKLTDKLLWCGSGPSPFLVAGIEELTSAGVDFDSFLLVLKKDFDSRTNEESFENAQIGHLSALYGCDRECHYWCG